MKLQPVSILTHAQICDLEKELGFNLPKDYVEFLSKYNGCLVNSSEARLINIQELNEEILINVFFGYETGSKNLDIVTWMNMYADDIIGNAVIIANDTGHGFIILICADQNEGVWYWDASCQFKQSTEDNNLYKICDSFSELLERL